MGKLARNAPKSRGVTTPVATTGERTLTGEGGIGWVRDVRSELFLRKQGRAVLLVQERDLRFDVLAQDRKAPADPLLDHAQVFQELLLLLLYLHFP
mgnify:CR=1 FL=1